MSGHLTHISLLKHGAVEAGDVFCGSLETSLSKQGWKQLKQKFSRNHGGWDAVVTSTKTQCAAFAEWFAQKNDLPLVCDERLREIDFGVWEGCSPQQILQLQPAELSDWWCNPAQYVPDKGESFDEFRNRVLDAWDDILRSNRGQRVLVVTHAGVIRVILAAILHIPDEALLSLNVEYAALTELRVLRDRSGEWTSLLAHGH